MTFNRLLTIDRQTGMSTGRILLWTVRVDGVESVLSGHLKRITCLEFSKDDKFLASGSDDCSVRLWDMHQGSLLAVISGESNDLFGLSFFFFLSFSLAILVFFLFWGFAVEERRIFFDIDIYFFPICFRVSS